MWTNLSQKKKGIFRVYEQTLLDYILIPHVSGAFLVTSPWPTAKEGSTLQFFISFATVVALKSSLPMTPFPQIPFQTVIKSKFSKVQASNMEDFIQYNWEDGGSQTWTSLKRKWEDFSVLRRLVKHFGCQKVDNQWVILKPLTYSYICTYLS